MYTNTFAFLPLALSLLSLSTAAPTGSIEYYPTPTQNSTLPAGPTGAPELPVCNVLIKSEQQWYKCSMESGFEGFCSQVCSSSWCKDYQTGTCTPVAYSGDNGNVDHGSHHNFNGHDNQDFKGQSQSSENSSHHSDSSYSSSHSSSSSHSNNGHSQIGPCTCPCCISGNSNDGRNIDSHSQSSQSSGQSESSASSNSNSESSSSTSIHKSQFYVCRSNGFQGRCSENPCGFAWCVDYIYKTYTPKPKYPSGNGGDDYNGQATSTGYIPFPTGTTY